MWIALSAYSAIPVPRFDWTEENMRFSICFLPLVGVIEVALLYLWCVFCGAVGIGTILFAVGATLIPLLLTGGIHMDGYCDTIDALSSHRDKEKMLEILKDPHAGAFAIIYYGIYLLASFGLYAELANTGGSTGIVSLPPYSLIPIPYSLFFIFMFSRAVTALSAVCIPKARGNGFLASFTANAHKRAVIISMVVVIVASGAAMVIVNPIPGTVGLACAGLAFLWYRHMVYSKFGGITGDTSGFFIQICELSATIGILAGVIIERA
jgi:adenosylcobinamide-GDP ribazoletransferase